MQDGESFSTRLEMALRAHGSQSFLKHELAEHEYMSAFEPRLALYKYICNNQRLKLKYD